MRMHGCSTARQRRRSRAIRIEHLGLFAILVSLLGETSPRVDAAATSRPTNKYSAWIPNVSYNRKVAPNQREGCGRVLFSLDISKSFDEQSSSAAGQSQGESRPQNHQPYLSTLQRPQHEAKHNVRSSSPSSAVKDNTRSSLSTTTHHHRQEKKRRRHPHPNNINDDDGKKRPVSRGKIQSMFRKAKDMERRGCWKDATAVFHNILELDPRDAHTHLALARLESRREKSTPAGHEKPESKARAIFQRGTELCPRSVHLWQAWALHEQHNGNVDESRRLYEQALTIDKYNPYVCHAFGLWEERQGHTERAQRLWEHALTRRSTAALICSLAELYVAGGRHVKARELYATHLVRLLPQTQDREITEVFMAAAWLEEVHFSDFLTARQLLENCLKAVPNNSRAQVALARLEGRHNKYFSATAANGASSKHGSPKSSYSSRRSNQAITRERLKAACTELEQQQKEKSSSSSSSSSYRRKKSDDDGRLFNAWAHIEVKSGRLNDARDILSRGIRQFPRDHSLLQAAGKVEERLGNIARARDLYSSSLTMEPSAPTLVAYAMLELRYTKAKPANRTTIVRRLFEEALLLDPRHGPAYNAYGNMERKAGNVKEARAVFERGVHANCTDVASVYHGLAQLELRLGNFEIARDVLKRGLLVVQQNAGTMDTNQRERAVFLAHTLGTLELNAHRPLDAKVVFEEGIVRHGNSSQLLLGAALCEGRLGNEDTARELFERAVKADSKHAQAWQAWGVMEMRAGRIKVAKTLFECGIQTRPTHGALWHAYATMMSRIGNFDIARSLFAAGIQKCPKHVPLYQGWSCLEMRGGNLELAKKLIGEALTRNKSSGSGWLVAAKIEERQGKDGLVGLILRRGLECAPNDPQLYHALAELEIKRNKINEARELLEKGLEVDPLHAPLYHSLAELEARVFNIEGLAKLNKRAANVFNTNALTPPPSMKPWEQNLKMGKGQSDLPDGIAALKLEFDLDLDGSLLHDLDPDEIIDQMTQFEDDVVGDLFQ